MIVLGADCDIDITYGLPAPPDVCVNWDTVTSEHIGECGDDCNGPVY